MLEHLIPHKGKGQVVALPLIIGLILFIIIDALSLNDRFIAPTSFLLSAFIIWFYDGGPEVLKNGFKASPRSKHTLIFIEIKYWAIVLGIIGCILLDNVLEKNNSSPRLCRCYNHRCSEELTYPHKLIKSI